MTGNVLSLAWITIEQSTTDTYRNPDHICDPVVNIHTAIEAWLDEFYYSSIYAGPDEDDDMPETFGLSKWKDKRSESN